MYDLGLYVGLFEIPRDLTGLPGLYWLKYDGLITLAIAIVHVLYYSWMVLLQLASEQGSALNWSYGYLK